jgi:hypothetical protein
LKQAVEQRTHQTATKAKRHHVKQAVLVVLVMVRGS